MAQTINIVLNISQNYLEASRLSKSRLQSTSRAEIRARNFVSCSTCNQQINLALYLVDDLNLLRSSETAEAEVHVENIKVEPLDYVSDVKTEKPVEPIFSPPEKSESRKSSLRRQELLVALQELSKEVDEDVLGVYSEWREQTRSFPHTSKKTLRNGLVLYFEQTSKSSLSRISLSNLRSCACEVCGFKASSRHAASQHYSRHFFPNPERDSPCLACGKSFGSKSTRFFHSLLCTSNERLISRLRCDLCDAEFSTVEERKKHNQVHCKRSCICHICSKVVKNEYRLMDHLRAEHDENPYLCEHCPDHFGSRKKLLYHLIRKHFSHLARLTCEICGVAFFDRGLLNAHKVTHEATKVECSHCNKSFTKSFLNVHILKKHTDNAKRYYCDFTNCGKVFFSKSCLELHQARHAPAHLWKWQCSGCQKKYPTKYKMNACEKKHREKTSCPVCGKSFADKGYLKEHMTLHTGERPYKCSICPKDFRDRSNFRAHLKHHEASLGVKLTLNKEERRLVQHNIIQENQFKGT